MNWRRVDWLQYAGTSSAVVGSLLVTYDAHAIRWWGFLLYLASNLLLIAWGARRRAWGICGMSVAFTVTSSIGLVRSWS